MARESSDIATEVVTALTHRGERPNPTDDVDYNVEKTGNNLYSMTSLPYNQRDIARQQDEILGPLSLFAPYVHEEQIIDEDLIPERPMTPIGEEIKGPCATFAQLSDYVLRRIVADSGIPHLEIEDQEALAGVLLGELNAIWTELRKQVGHPFLTREQNHELKRLMTVRVVNICQTLFYQYVEKAQILNRRGVFTGAANVSRLKSQLGLEAHKNLNVPSIRRWAQAMLLDVSDDDDEVISDKLSQSKQSSRRRSGSARKPAVPSIRSSPRRRSPRRKPFTIERELRDLQGEMPVLQTDKLMSLLEEMDQLRERPASRSRADDSGSQLSLGKKTKSTKKVKRARSLDESHRDETLADELELPGELKRSDSTDLTNIPCLMKPDHEKPKEKQPMSDLERLMSRQNQGETKNVEEDMPPLIQAITRSSKHDNKREKIDQQLKELEKKEEEYIKRKQVRPEEKPTYPQPSTVAGKLPNKMPVRASDVRVSERVCLSSFTIGTYHPLYNDLAGEVDQNTVKSMDKNLFMGDEIKEVYHEIMKTIPDDHLTLANDELILPTAESVNTSSILMPSALNARTKDKIVNKSIQRRNDPPWRKQNIMQWGKTPVNQLRDVKFESGQRSKTESDITAIPGMVLTVEEYREQLSDHPRQMQERMARNYQSWLTWWNSTTNSEDYMKYLASQETDYLGYIFHFYDSEDEEDSPTKTPSSKKGRGAKASPHGGSLGRGALEEAELEELRSEKNAYNPGFWNAGAVLMGGLGKEPSLEDEERNSTPISDVTQTSYMNLGKRIRLRSDVSQHSMRSVESQLSKTIIDKQNASIAEAKRLAELNKPKGPSPQERLEKVWAVLQMPDHQKLDMAIKYSSDQFIGLLGEAIEAWENATELVLERESMMSKLETFERSASDPHRFFEKGFRGSGAARLEEAKQRSHHYKRLDEMEKTIRETLGQIEADFQDKITFQGRVYVDKMQWDRVEMLFWLQEERKQNVLEKHTVAKNLRKIPLSRQEPTLTTI